MDLESEHMNVDQKIVVQHTGDIVKKKRSDEFAKIKILMYGTLRQ